MTTSRSAALKLWPFTDFLTTGTGLRLAAPPVVDGPVGPTVVHDGRTLINFASTNFLNLQARTDVRQHFLDGITRYGLTTGGSRATLGICRPHLELERELCRVTGKDRAISFASGLLANVGFAHTMTNHLNLGQGWEIDNQDAMFVLDRDVNWSLWKAVEKLRYGRQLFPFRHNDPADLDRALSTLEGKKDRRGLRKRLLLRRHGRPDRRAARLCEQHQALSYVDNANGFLLYGGQGRPFTTEFDALRRADFVMVSFSKSVGLEGGAIAGLADPLLAFELLSGTSMFTGAMPPPTASTAPQVMHLLRTKPEIVDDYLRQVAGFRVRLDEIVCPPRATPSYLISVPADDDATAVELKESFLERGYLVPVFFYPAVSRNKPHLRLTLNSGHTEEHREGFLDTFADLGGRLGLDGINERRAGRNC
ncbi:aminotransferase class I/II-fold pyridoxal phosphate-dependent enzyme [Amycolatopsis sp. NPDC049868]|uniref:aminotransferase class I/II-fold pyridoxal phosphate-dependent enzyme n=1 Tax=Amycolatopsis sp. NPDC049868 TaxID=3363934 RepID=UPI0037899BC9